MNIIHHVNFNTLSAQDLWDALSKTGIEFQVTKLPGGGGNLVSFDIAESDSNWSLVFDLLKTYQGFNIYHGGDIYDTVFSESEIREAEWARLVPIFYQGYPYPKGNWPFKQNSLTNVCHSCAIFEQNKPLQIYSEPRMGKNSFLALNMLRGEVFATPEVFARLDAIGAKGYEAHGVICNRSKSYSEKVQQLYIPEIAKAGLLHINQMRQVLCQECGVVKYYPHKKGEMFISRDAMLSGTDFIRTDEWFGVGYNAWREVLVSNRIANLILDEKWIGVQLKVVSVV